MHNCMKNLISRLTSNKRTMQILLGFLAILAVRCVQPAPQGELWRPPSGEQDEAPIPITDATQMPAQIHPTVYYLPTRDPEIPVETPTPNVERVLPTARVEATTYTMQAGDTLAIVSNKFNVPVDMILAANDLPNPDIIPVGQVLNIPGRKVGPPGSDFKIIPDSELVYGPYSSTLDIFSFIQSEGGFLSKYREKIGDTYYSGAEIVQRVSQEFSVNPRILLAVLEYQSGWLTNAYAVDEEYPMGLEDKYRKGLYLQLSWAANAMNRGYYLWQREWIAHFSLTDKSLVPISGTLNAGTVGVQYLMSDLYDRAGWDSAVSETGVFAVYEKLFGFPFDYAIDDLILENLASPEFQLPFEKGDVWYHTGGPHAGWGTGSAWAAIDFAPKTEENCAVSEEWVTAAIDGQVLRSGDGVVVIDTDGDGLEQTGWTLLYLHIATEGRVPAGAMVKRGDRIGHASCEGGVSNGTHVHLARRYNGQWIWAAGSVPFILDGWVVQSSGSEYNGYLERGAEIVEAWDRAIDENRITR